MTPVIALVGRPNVGKSTLFNVLTRSRAALVADFPGLTRDRLYGRAQWLEQPLMVIDTGGIDDQAVQSGIVSQMAEQSLKAIDEADVILFLVDGRCGLTSGDTRIAQQLRRTKKPILVAVNKIEGLDTGIAVADFYRLGLGDNLFPIAAAHDQGVAALMQQVMASFDHPTFHSTSVVSNASSPAETTLATDALSTDKLSMAEPPDRLSAKSLANKQATTAQQPPASTCSTQRGLTGDHPIKVAIVGRPNVGKSLLTNAILGEQRVVVYDLPGTTRDSVTIPLQRQGRHYAIIDTAGVRRRAKVSEKIEKFSIVKTLQAIEHANVVLMIIDAQQGISDQDLSLLAFILESGRALVVVVNKWDGLDQQAKTQVKRNLERRLDFINFARHHFVSALQGRGVSGLFASITEAYESAIRPISTGVINRILQQAQTEHLPPLVRGRRIKLKYAHLGGHNPPTIVIHGNQVNELPEAYRRYLTNYYRQALKIVGTPIYLQLKAGENPYAHQRNALTITQQRKRQRLIQHHKQRERSISRRRRVNG